MIRGSRLYTPPSRSPMQLECAKVAAVRENPLSKQERRELDENEQAIRRGAKAWLELGVALLTIRDKKLHRQMDENFESYCFARFRLERSCRLPPH